MIRTVEFVIHKHPDKICDRISTFEKSNLL